MRKLHIGLVIYGHLDLISGGYLYNKKLVEYWRANGHQVTLFQLPWRSYWRHFGDNFDLNLLRRLTAAPIDLLIQDELNHPSMIGLNGRIKRQCGYPVVSLIHLLRASEPHSPLARSIYGRLERHYLNGLDGVICNSNATAQNIRSMTKGALSQVVAYPGKDHWSLSVSEREVVARARETGPLRILFVGNLIRRKGLHTLLTALSELDPKLWRLTAIGRQDLEPAYARKVKEMIEDLQLSDRVELLGPQPVEKMAPYYKDHQLFVMPSFYEPFGIVYLEAMGAGLAVIAAQQGAGPELIRPGVNGFLIEHDAAEILKDQISRLAHDRQLLGEMGIAGLARHAQHPTWAETGDTITSYLESLLP